MTQALGNISRFGFGAIVSTASASYVRLGLKAPSNEVIVLGILLAALQVADGVLTSIGISRFGLWAEGNGFLRFLMETWGPSTALLIMKGLAIVVVGILCALSHYVTWLPKAMKLLISAYLCLAIIPWLLILGGFVG